MTLEAGEFFRAAAGTSRESPAKHEVEMARMSHDQQRSFFFLQLSTSWWLAVVVAGESFFLDLVPWKTFSLRGWIGGISIMQDRDDARGCAGRNSPVARVRLPLRLSSTPPRDCLAARSSS